MIGAIIGDIVGSPYELNIGVDKIDFQPLFHPTLSKFTDDTVLTCATADALLSNITNPPFHIKYKEWALKYPNRGYGSTFWEWANNSDLNVVKNKSYANGCMMRCSPIGDLFWLYDILVALNFGKESIEWTHNSPESLRGTSAILTAICMSYQGKTKEQIKAVIEENYGCWLDTSIEVVKNNWDKRNIRCNITCAQSLICFLNSEDYESAIRLAVYSQGDVDTIAAIAGSIAEAYYGVDSIPRWIIENAKNLLSQEMVDLINKFYKYLGNYNSKYKDFII